MLNIDAHVIIPVTTTRYFTSLSDHIIGGIADRYFNYGLHWTYPHTEHRKFAYETALYSHSDERI